eukprot:CAMPEP_0180136390 /NCGR_PEP_ID=MMETSP0986-20121125/11473_1 /TAXON_ID=697907 /ORGANISM="non described non described, Strain CCMP2293" /LENGTH=85 /DNA_ID=CAMNT_0022077421 /DNA_START=232 /DNA_END=488 /DNA_ORIENTATION=-
MRYRSSTWNPESESHAVLASIDVLVDHEGGPARVLGVALSDLADCPVTAEEIVELLGRDLERQVANEEDAVHFGGQARILPALHH